MEEDSDSEIDLFKPKEAMRRFQFPAGFHENTPSQSWPRRIACGGTDTEDHRPCEGCLSKRKHNESLCSGLMECTKFWTQACCAVSGRYGHLKTGA
jgi:hypothetical protein